MEINCISSLYEYAKLEFKYNKKKDFTDNKHYKTICDHLEMVFTGKIKNLIVTIPPRIGKSEFVCMQFISWALSIYPDSNFIYSSYSIALAREHSEQTRDIVESDFYASLFPHVKMKKDKKTKHHWKTTAGGAFYASGAGGSITGFGAGTRREGFGGCFAYEQEIITNKGNIPIGKIVEDKLDVKVFSYDEKIKKTTEQPISQYWENGLNDMFEFIFPDKSTILCTPNHRFLFEGGWVSAIEVAKSLCLIEGKFSHFAGLLNGDIKVHDNIKLFACWFNIFRDAVPSSNSFNLEESKTCNGRCFISGDSSIFSDFNLFLGGLLSILPIRVREILCNAFPSLSSFNLSNNSNTDIKFFSKSLCIKSTFEYFNNLFSCKDCCWSFFEDGKSPVPYSILHILGLSAITEIAKSVITGIAVKMPSLMFGGSFANELLKHEAMNASYSDFAINGKSNIKMSRLSFNTFEDFSRINSLDSSKIGNFIQTFGVANSFPNFFRYIGHKNSYCLGIDGYNNFILTQNKVIAKNCFIIDDPLKADEAHSQVKREAILRWYHNTVVTRLNKPETPIIMIMQRLHENDLVGEMLELDKKREKKGQEKKWTHLNIPAISTSGEAEFPQVYTMEWLKNKEQEDVYNFSSQFMQNPSPFGGSIFKRNWWRFYEAGLFSLDWGIITADTAQKTGEHNDWTVYQCWGFTEGGAYLISQIRAKVEVPDLKNLLVGFFRDMQRILTIRSVLIEDKVSGTGLIQELKRDRYYPLPVEAVQRNRDKVVRAYDVAGYVSAGRVFLPKDWDDIDDFLNEFTSFTPTMSHAHDDQVDATCDALNYIFSHTAPLFQ